MIQSIRMSLISHINILFLYNNSIYVLFFNLFVILLIIPV